MTIYNKNQQFNFQVIIPSATKSMDTIKAFKLHQATRRKASRNPNSQASPLSRLFSNILNENLQREFHPSSLECKENFKIYFS